jgi:hypothetical protein
LLTITAPYIRHELERLPQQEIMLRVLQVINITAYRVTRFTWKWQQLLWLFLDESKLCGYAHSSLYIFYPKRVCTLVNKRARRIYRLWVDLNNSVFRASADCSLVIQTFPFRSLRFALEHLFLLL